MEAALHVKTMILPGGKIEIHDPDLPPGESVDVIIFRRRAAGAERHSAVEILAGAPGHRLFKTAAEVDAYLQEERESWEH
jgi:hypothetical protein